MGTGDIYSTMVLVFVCLALALVRGTHGMSIGVSADACTTLTPDYVDPTTGLRYSPQAGPTPYVLTVQPKIYTSNQVITVTVESWSNFEGILLQARVGTSSTPVGTWAPLDGYTIMSCSNAGDFLTHSSTATKVPSVQFQWTAPSASVGTVTFTATISKNKETFWTPLKAVVVNGVTAGACSSSPCLNGLCFTGTTSSYFCSCNTGFIGTNCETRRVPTCPNGLECYEGTCFTSQSDANRYLCVCENDYLGTNCIQRPTACIPTNPCKNGGTCYLSNDNSQNHICVCATGYESPNCEQPTVPNQPCDSNPCQNGGICADNGNVYSCTCSAGYEGTKCDVTTTQRCDSNPCQNGGVCANNGNVYSCTCSAGYEGTNCDVTTTQPCDSNPCKNGGICADNGNVYSCTCSAGYEGTNCDVTITPTPTTATQPCDSNPCQNGGNCANNGNVYSCTCIAGYEGTNCDVTISCSLPNYPCANGGSCTVEGVCDCREGFNGDRCELRQSACSLNNPCENGGTCSNQGVCTCPAGYMGTRCEDAITTTTCIEGTTCMNGGSCSAAQDQICKCSPEYTGDNCEIPVTNYCESTVCQNGGTCINRESRFSCACKDGYNGISCATFTGSPTTPENRGLQLEVWWIALIALIGALLIVILIAACYTILRSSHAEERHMVGNKR